ncbi:MAG: AsmA family protein [Hyphomicrobium sp.]|nr:AsmA family protein [Hyphomicrobium sp.]
MNNLLLTLAGLLIVVLSALFAVPYAIDWNSYRGVLEEEASRVLGREVRVGGNVVLRLLPAPYVSVEKLRVADNATELGRPIFRAEGFTLWLSVPPLLKGILEAREVELTKPEVELALDKDGQGNWTSMAIAPGSLPFAPTTVALQSVKVTGGAVGFTGPGGVELARVTAIDGILSADDLAGPYRFKGTVVWSGSLRDVRLTTAKRDPDGGLRFKSVVDVAASGNTYTFDGRIAGLDSALEFEGDLVAKVTPASLALTGAASAASGAAPPATASADGLIEIRSKVSGTGKKLELGNIEISIDRGGVPQLVSGRAGAAWSDRVSLNVKLASKWIDVDRLTETAGAVPPLERARALFDRLVDALPSEADANVDLVLDQVGIGGDVMSGVAIHARRAGGNLELDDVRASLPGGTQALIDGAIEDEKGARTFKGTLALGGQSLMRFTAWGFGETPFSRLPRDGPFSVEGQLVLSDKTIELSDATAEIDAMPLTGSVLLGLGEKRRAAVSLEGQRIDLASLWPGNPGLAGLRSLVFAGVVAPSAEGATAEKSNGSALGDVSVDIKAAELIDGDRKLRDAHVEVALAGGGLSIPRLAFMSDGGLSVDLTGGATGMPDEPKGALRGIIDAPTSEAVVTLARLVNTPADAQAIVDRAASLAPWRAGATFSFGERTPSAVDVALDGTIEGERMVLAARFDGARTNWREAPADVSASVATRDVDRLLERIAGVRSVPDGDVPAARPGNLFFKAAGTPSAGLVAVAELDAERLSLDFNGRMSVPDLNNIAAKGDVRVDAADARGVMALAGIVLGPGAAGAGIKGKVATALENGVLTLASPDLKLGRSKVSGVVTLARETGAGSTKIDADIVADAASLPGLLGAVTGRPEPVTAAMAPPAPVPASRTKRNQVAVETTEALPAIEPTIWSGAPFDFRLLDSISGTVKASIRSLDIDTGVALKDARVEIALGDGAVKVERLEGAMLGGKAVSKFSLERLAAGAALNGGIDIAVSSTGSAESHGGDEIVGDVAAMSLSFEAKALTPDALIGALSGKGDLKLGDVALKGVSPSAVGRISDLALEGKVASSGPELAAALKTELDAEEFKLGKIAVPVRIEDGALKLDQVAVESSGGRATFDAALDLRSLKLASTWNIEGEAAARAQPSVPQADTVGAPSTNALPLPLDGERKTLPPVLIVFAGRLAELDGLEPSIVADSLERELLVRRMERDVSELERLRRLDELRAKQEAARLKELERQKDVERQKEIDRQKALEAERLRLEQLDQPVDGALPAPEGAPNGAAGEAPGAVPADGAATAGSVDPAAAAEAAAAGPAAPPRPRRPTQPKKRAQETWQPFQITPYQ